MDKFSVSANFRTPSSSRLLPLGRRYVNPDVFLDRMDRLNARRQDGRAGAIDSAPQHPDAALLRECEALDSAWRYEVATVLVQKRLNTPEADAIAEAARAASAQIARRIEAARAVTLDGLKAKAQAILWSRHGEPLEDESLEGGGADQAATSILRD
jgi:hypothetical protein